MRRTALLPSPRRRSQLPEQVACCIRFSSLVGSVRPPPHTVRCSFVDMQGVLRSTSRTRQRPSPPPSPSSTPRTRPSSSRRRRSLRNHKVPLPLISSSPFRSFFPPCLSIDSASPPPHFARRLFWLYGQWGGSVRLGLIGCVCQESMYGLTWSSTTERFQKCECWQALCRLPPSPRLSPSPTYATATTTLRKHAHTPPTGRRTR